MLLRCGVLLLYLNFLVSSEIISANKAISEVDGFSFWPSVSNGVRLMRIRKRDIDMQSEGGNEKGTSPVKDTNEGQQPLKPIQQVQKADQPHDQVSIEQSHQQIGQQPHNQANVQPHIQSANTPDQQETLKEPVEQSPKLPAKDQAKNVTSSTNEKKETLYKNATHDVSEKFNTTLVEKNAASSQTTNLSDPGVIKRALIVFGGFAILGIAYFIFYRKKNGGNDPKNVHSSIDANQFRYGVLDSEDKRNNGELSRMPLTMESDDDDDEDLEIFDLGQKKKSLSYINLQTHDDDIVFSDAKDNDMENILVDIEDKNSDPLINWSGNGSKSIL